MKLKALSIVIGAVMCTVSASAGPSKPLWSIGEADAKPDGFALAPDGFRDFIENDFGWTEHHPVVEAYKSYLQMPYDRPSWDLTAVLAAVENGPEYFTMSPWGRITVTDAGATIFEEGEGNRAWLSVTPLQAGKIKERIVSIVPSVPGK